MPSSMTNSPFLIAHLVRGQPAFDIAEQIECPICKGDYDIDRDEESMCVDCDDTGYWWIIPTSGHRAYPFWNKELPATMEQYEDKFWEVRCGDLNGEYASYDRIESIVGWPDHYAINNRALRSAPTSSLADRLGLNLRQPSAPIRRRV